MAHQQESNTFTATALEFSARDIRMVNGARVENRSPQIFDHFVYGAGALNSAVPQHWVTTDTHVGTGNAPFAPSTSVTGGAIVGVTGSTTADAQEVSGKAIIWKPSTMAGTKRLVFEARAKFVGATTATDGDFVVGLADANTYTSGLAYVVSAASALTTSAPVEFAGFIYSSVPTSGTLYSASGNYIGYQTEKNSVAATVAATSTIKDSSYHLYRVEVDSSGNVTLWLDDTFVASVASAVTAATSLTPYIACVNRNSHAVTATVDWIYVGGDKV